MKFPVKEILNLSDMKVLDFQEIEGIGIVMTIEKSLNYCSCPSCGRIAPSIHQNHWRTIHDLPWSEKTVLLKINRRQFKCKKCKKVFSEKLDFVEKNSDLMIKSQTSSLLESPFGNLQVSELPSTSVSVIAQGIQFSLVIPTYKESDNIKNVVIRLSQTLDEFIPGDYELIVVDDDSPDHTWEVALSLMQEYPQLQVMRRQQERGLSTAVIRGWQAASGSILGVIDGDLQHPPHVLQELLREIQNGADLAVASRNVEGGGLSSWSFARRFLSRGAQLLGLVILPRVLSRVSDPMSGYFLVRRNSIANVIFNPVGYKILLEVIGRGKVNHIAEVGYVFCERKEGESKVTWKQYVDYIHHLMRLRLSTGRLARAGITTAR